jgi:hypothetical protein
LHFPRKTMTYRSLEGSGKKWEKFVRTVLSWLFPLPACEFAAKGWGMAGIDGEDFHIPMNESKRDRLHRQRAPPRVDAP